jgi:MATE family multidrug resistance protein
VGVQVMTARAIGRGDQHETGAVWRRGLSYGFWLGLGGALILMLGGPLFLHSVGLERSLADGSSRVLMVLAVSLPVSTFAVACSSWLEAHARPTPPMIINWLGNLVNLAFVIPLTVGWGPIPALGAVGAAIGTIFARSAVAGALFLYIVRLKEAREWGVFDKPRRDPPAEAEQRRIGYGSAASNFFEVASFSGMNIIAGWVGALTVAGYSIVLSVASVVFMVPLGLGTATAVMVGRAYGRRDEPGITRAAMIGFGATFAFGLAASLIIWLAASPIAAAYTTDAAAIALVVPALILSAIFLAPDALQVVTAQSLRARGDVWLPTWTHMTSYAVIMVPLGYLFAIPLHMGLNGMLWAIIASTYLSAALLLGRFWMLSRR